MKKILTAIFLLLLCAALTACGHEHQWQEANCTSPKTCSECGETEGEALGHTWSKPSCTEGSVCAVCGAAGEAALGHDWLEATLFEPKTCRVCGETEGVPNTYFVSHGIELQELPEEFYSHNILYTRSGKHDQQPIETRYYDTGFVYNKLKDDTKEILFRYRCNFMAPANFGGYFFDFNIFDVYTGQVIPIRPEDHYEVPLEIDGKTVTIGIANWNISEWFVPTDEGIKTDNYLYINFRLPADYDGLVLAVGDLKAYGYDDEAWLNLQYNGMVPEDYYNYPEYYDGVTFYRLSVEGQSPAF